MGTAASTALSGRTGIVINLENQKALDLNTILDPLKISSGVDWSFGVGANQANLLFHDKDSTDVTGKTVNVYDGGVLKTAFGDLLTMEAIKLLYIKNTHASLTLEVFGGVAADIPILADSSDILEIPPGGVFLWTCPTPAGIVTTTNKNLKFASKTTGTVTFEYAVLGLD